jgi:hypothetical protein
MMDIRASALKCTHKQQSIIVPTALTVKKRKEEDNIKMNLTEV